MRDPYEVLGIGRNASADEIKAAFRKSAGSAHPDRNPNDPAAHDRFKELNEAHQILSDPNKRRLFDQFGAAPFDRAGGQGSPFDVGAADGILADLLGVLGVKRDTGDLRQRVTVTFEEAALGCDKVVEYSRLDICARCRGSGAAPKTRVERCAACNGRGRVKFQQGVLPFPVERACSRCRGIGKIPERPCTECSGAGLGKVFRALDVTFPAGIEHGASRVVEGAGSRPGPDRAAGNLEIVVTVKKHPFFRRDGDDIVCACPITFAQAALGSEVLVPTLDGKATVRVPPATQPGSVLRLRGKGVPHRVRSGRGDQLVEVSVEVPTRLTDRARELVSELAGELGEDVQPQQKTFVEKLRGLFG